jgi:type IX secretion system PorP/SprF family membrane protein
MKKYFPLFLFSFFYLNSIKAQDPIFSQNLCTRTYLNPAIAGTDSTLAISAGYRNQWAGINGTTYATTHFSADQYVRFLRGGIGLDIIHDVAGQGPLTTTNINFSYAPHFELFNHTLSLQPGFSIGYFQKSIDVSQLTLPSNIGFQHYSSSPYQLSKKTNVDLNAGLFMYTKKFYGGISVMHINEPDEGLIGPAKLPYKLTIHAGVNLNFKKDINHNFTLSPNVIFQRQQNFNGVVVGITTKYKWFLLGVNYRNRDSMIYNIGFQNRFLKVGYTYDYTTSKLTNATGGSHEIQVIWFLHYQKKACKINTIRFI